MGRIPGGREVEQSLRESLRQVKSALEQINDHATKLLARGDYSKAEELISSARKVGEFESELEAVRRRWREIYRGSDTPNRQKEKPLPLWKYYEPTLQALSNLGSKARREAIEQEMEPRVGNLFPASERDSLRKRPRWMFMVRRALRAMEKEGFVQRVNGEWCITFSGQKAAEGKTNSEGRKS